MARFYEFVFRASGGEQFTLRGYGNTRSSAERSARLKLRDDRKRDPRKFYTAGCALVPEGDR